MWIYDYAHKKTLVSYSTINIGAQCAYVKSRKFEFASFLKIAVQTMPLICKTELSLLKFNFLMGQIAVLMKRIFFCSATKSRQTTHFQLLGQCAEQKIGAIVLNEFSFNDKLLPCCSFNVVTVHQRVGNGTLCCNSYINVTWAQSQQYNNTATHMQ